MDIHFTRPNPKDAAHIAPFFTMRPNKTCDSGVLDTFLWSDYYGIQTAVVDEKAVLVLQTYRTISSFFSSTSIRC